jgi:hypothetical protein
LGDGGSITRGFGADFSTSGDGTADGFVDEWGNTDCYYVCVVPADNFTTQAMQLDEKPAPRRRGRFCSWPVRLARRPDSRTSSPQAGTRHGASKSAPGPSSTAAEGPASGHPGGLDRGRLRGRSDRRGLRRRAGRGRLGGRWFRGARRGGAHRCRLVRRADRGRFGPGDPLRAKVPRVRAGTMGER